MAEVLRAGHAHRSPAIAPPSRSELLTIRIPKPDGRLAGCALLFDGTLDEFAVSAPREIGMDLAATTLVPAEANDAF